MVGVDKEKAIRAIVRSDIESYARTFAGRHISEVDNEDGVINMKIHNVFVAALGPEIQYYSALARSLDSSLGNMLEKMAIRIASLNYTVSQHVDRVLYTEQTDYIAELLEKYKRHALTHPLMITQALLNAGDRLFRNVTKATIILSMKKQAIATL